MTALQQLLNESEVPENSAASKRREVQELKPVEHVTVVKTGASAGVSSIAGVAKGVPTVSKKKDLWAPEEVKVAAEALAAPDGRLRPQFDFAFAQRVGAADVYLGLQGTTPSSIHCDVMTMKIVLPGERFADIDLDITNDRISLSASRL